MANYVSTNITFNNIEDKTKKRLKELYKRIREGEREWLGDIFVEEGKDLTYEETEQYSWTIDNLGSKWVYIEDKEEDEEYENYNDFEKEDK